MLNLSLMKEPMNWIIITLMVMLGAMAVRYIFVSAKAAPADS